jgi:hypothetical protein
LLILQKQHTRIKSPLRKQSTSLNDDTQVVANDAFTSVEKTSLASGNRELVSGLFFGSEFDAQGLPAELAKLVTVWPKLAEHIKAAINALAQIHEAQ